MDRMQFPDSYQWLLASTDNTLFLFEHPNTMDEFSEKKCFSRFEKLYVARPPDHVERFTRIHFNREIAAWCEENFRGTYMIRYGEPVCNLSHQPAFTNCYEIGFDNEVDWLLFKFRWS